MEHYVVNENGEKVLAGSRRPDGTVRKERRIRAGYTPQDEQPVFQTTGVMARQGIPKCPGLAPEQASAAAASAKSKAAKKNEKRKAKKPDGPGSETQQPSSSSTAAAAKPAAPKPAAAPAPAAAAAAAPPAADGGAAVLDKQIKALGKKVRQCQALVDRQAAGGEALSQQEQEKVAKMPGWQEEIRQLEHQMAKLGT